VSFAVGTNSKPNADVAEFVCLTCLTRKNAPACVLISCAIGSRDEVPEVHADLRWRCGDQGRDFDDGGAAVEVGKSCLLMSVFCVKNECRGEIRSTNHVGWESDVRREVLMSFDIT